MGIDPEALQDVAFAVNDPRAKYARASRLIDRVMLAACSVYEWAVLRFVLERSLAYGKDYEHIPEHHFLHGVWTTDGLQLHPPLPISKAQLYRAINTLCDKKMLLKTNDRGPTRHRKSFYMINLSFDFDNVAKGFDVGGHLNLSKKRKKSADQSLPETNVSLPETKRSLPETANISSDTKVRSKLARSKVAQPNPIVLQTDTLQDALALSVAKSSAARAKHKAKGNVTGLLKVYEDAFRLTYEGDPYVPPTDRNWVAFCRSLNRARVEDHQAFIEWMVKNYVEVAKSKFRFLLKESNHPQLPFITSKIATFVLAFADAKDPNRDVDRRIRNRQLGLVETPVEKNELEQLREKVRVLSEENTGLKAGQRNADFEERADRAIAKGRKLKRSVLKRPAKSDEFGEWGD